MKIAVVGAGYVGVVTAVCFAEFGVDVTGVDRDARRVQSLNLGVVPFYEPGLAELLRKNRKEGRLRFTQELAKAVRESRVIFIAVGTPSRGDGSADLQYVEEVARVIGENLNAYKVVVTKSTVPVGTGERIRQWILAHRKREIPFDIASNPEFLREGSALEDFMRPNRVVIGTESEQAREILRTLYRPLYLIETPFVFTDIPTAEMIKYASNAFLATKISFINEVANLCERVGADVHVVARALGLDRRIGPKFLHPGPGYGGSCLPKDTAAFVQLAESHGYDLRIVRTVMEVNRLQRLRMVEKIRNAVGGLQDRTLGILGLSFKPNTDDIREAPALDIVERLLQEGARIRAYDPAAMEAARARFPQITYCSNPYEVAQGAHALVLVTEWNQFRNLDLEQIRSLLQEPILVDLRNVYEPAQVEAVGLRYYGVGRGRPA